MLTYYPIINIVMYVLHTLIIMIYNSYLYLSIYAYNEIILFNTNKIERD